MAWMDAYEAAELRAGRTLEDLFGPEYADSFAERDEVRDEDGWELRGGADLPGGSYHHWHSGEFIALVRDEGRAGELTVFASGPGGSSSGYHQVPLTVPDAKEYAMKLVAALRLRCLEGARA